MPFGASSGFAAPGFEAVSEEFARNVAERGELGAAFAAVRDGELVVDHWVGDDWAEDTAAAVFSGTKGLVAVCILMLVDRGLLDLESPVAEYWPEFGKLEILVRNVVSHTARMPGISAPLEMADILDGDRMAELLAAQKPSDDRRAGLCYHAFTYGWLCGELVRRIDGRSLGAFFSDEVAKPLGLDIWIGLDAAEEHRVARIELADGWPATPALQAETWARDPLLASIWANPPTLARESFPWNEPTFHQAEIPAIGGIATARSLATLYGTLDRLLSPKTLALARTSLAQGFDEVHGSERRFGVGFQLQTEARGLGPPADAFGHDGAGGSVHGVWPSERVGFSYVTSLLRDDAGDTRAAALLAALHRSLATPSTRPS